MFAALTTVNTNANADANGTNSFFIIMSPPFFADYINSVVNHSDDTVTYGGNQKKAYQCTPSQGDAFCRFTVMHQNKGRDDINN